MTKKKKRIILLALLVLFASVALVLGRRYFPFARMVRMPAGSEKEFTDPEKSAVVAPNTLYYDFEVAPGKEMPNGFYKGLGHSGEYAVKAFGQNSFSVVIERTAKEIGVENLKAVAISAWIYVFPTKTEVKGRLVFTASNEVGVNVCWVGVSLVEPEVPRGQWFKISGYFDLGTVQFKPDHKLQFYFWNNTGTDILIDDYFVSFGGPAERRGDSARVDMTRPGGYVPKFNHPPFPVNLLHRETMSASVPPAATGTGDLMVAGDFFNTGHDGLITVARDGKITAFAYCQEERSFRKINISQSPRLTAISPVHDVVKGKFLPAGGDQLLVTGEKGALLMMPDKVEEPCKKDEPGSVGMRVIWESPHKTGRYIAGDFDGNRRSELLEIAADGSWRVFSADLATRPGELWKALAHGDKPAMPAWDGSLWQTSITAGQFLASYPGEIVLTVAKNKTDGRLVYALHRLNIPGNRWDPLYGTRQENLGKTIGIDTLKPDDSFLVLQKTGNKKVVYRYNRDWRFDLKEIAFNDSAFTILHNMDFSGYEKDRNPKYYESLELVPGNFQNPGEGSLLVIGRVAVTRHYEATLPDFVQLFSPAKK